jgi:hypothetical protein
VFGEFLAISHGPPAYVAECYLTVNPPDSSQKPL